MRNSKKMPKCPQDTLSTFVIAPIAIFHLAINIYVPCLPSIAESFNAHRDSVQISVGSFLIGSALANLAYGILSDHFGRKPVLIIGLFIFLLTTALCVFSSTIEILIIMRTLQGVGSGCISVLCFTMVQEKYPFKKTAQVMGWIGICREMVIAFSPILGGYLVVAFGWRSTFLIVALALIGLLYYANKHLAETFSISKRRKILFKPIFKDYRHIVSNLKFIRYVSIFPFLLCGLWCYLTVMPFYFITVLKIPTELFGYYIAPAAVTYSFGSILVPKLIHRFGVNSTLSLGLYVCLMASMGHLILHFVFPHHAISIVIVQSFYVMGLAFVFAPSVAKAVEPFRDKLATANSIGAMIRQVCGGLGGIAGGFFDDSGMFSVAVFLIFLSSFALIIFKFLSSSPHPFVKV